MTGHRPRPNATSAEPERDAFDTRPTGEEMLARVQAETPGSRGRLRIYLGMAPGVGKTYRMLEEGHRRLERGTDLVVGFVEAHGRPLTTQLLDGLEVLPRRRIEYREVVVEEMDTDAVLARRPVVVLVDELAHTNVPGSAHAKRWEDVEVIRDAGIHVVSTMNVQHLDSVADAVATITGASVNERLPDEVLWSADEIELVDMSPHALRQRMRHGNVYPPERASVALDRFFTEANLTALRELSLRVVAQRVEGQVEGSAIGGRLPLVTERVLVLVDGGPAAPRALRRAARLAGLMHASLSAVVVVTPESEREPFDRHRDLQESIDDASDLGATVIRVEAQDVATGVAQVARDRGVTHVVLPYRELSGVRRLLDRPLVDKLVALLPDVELHLVAAPARGSEPQS
jgi:two-component system, OmpR family, sensor histidine kinase KdpD